MRSLAALSFLPVLLAAQIAAPSKAKVHGFSLSGAVVRIDEAKKTLAVRNAGGKETTLVWTNATNVFGGKLAVGQAVTLKYLDRDGKHIATSIRIGPPPAAASPPPAPTAVSR
jgi:hypothetical protein